MLIPRAALLLGLAACVPAQSANDRPDANPRPDVAEADTLRGIVRVVGADPATWLAIYPTYTAATNLSGAPAEPLRSVSGADVWVSGHARGNQFEVARFVVRAIDGQPVHDGLLTRAEGRLRVELAGGGTAALDNPPPQLDALVGSRVWVTRPPPGVGLRYGVIR